MTMTHAEAESALGRKVVYRPYGQPSTREEGVLVGVSARGARVRYGADYGSKLTNLEDLELINPPSSPPVPVVDSPDSVTHFRCTVSIGGAPHHLITVHKVAGNELRCVYCGKTEAALRKELGLDA